MIALMLALLATLLGGALFHLARTQPSLAVPLTVAITGVTLLATCVLGIVAR
ncbi:hypothetical protein OU787_18610 [Kitasatospora sp. YST-16]|uniref:hypothetical protein n=1 Tax=Kitasatospora sp. YST-16 TaxID=2998080 RepID=UPI002284DE75|nr:hypothetical protein [Kitasatospora sp. YST-16]WAL73342.1 hypothetical protein OU787_18610 [Kitasatospora sp. YST-16]WNW39398.1 hypothetical protein RKE32_18570 [Streptomyces sp. Li-HN-5-13]